MTGFSQPERKGLERIQGLQTAQTHPDADQLAAFCEQTLSAREREQVLLHLAGCENCREVTALAFPETVEIAAAQTAGSASFWKWPVMRWGVVAASAVIVVVAVSIGINDRQQKAERLRAYSTDAAPLTAPGAPSPVSASPITDSSAAKSTTGNVAQPGKESDKVEALQSKGSATAGRDAEALAKQDRDEKAQPEATKIAVNDGLLDKDRTREEAKKESGAAVGGMVSAPPARAMAPLQAAEARADAASGMAKAAPGNSPALAGAKPAAPSAAETVTVAQALPVQSNRVEAYRQTAPLAADKTTAADGRLAKSSDLNLKLKREQPKNAVAESASSLTASTGYQYNALSNEWKVTPQGDLLNSNDLGQNWVQQLPGQKFTHVQSIRNHVWASGPNGMLMHSSDAGLTWSQVKPSGKDSAMQGEIISINFADENRGVVKTSAHETWSTADGGKSWRKQ